jgi:hypothetical protein
LTSSDDLYIPSYSTLKLSGSSITSIPNINNNGTIESTTSTVTTQLISSVTNYALFTVKGGKCVVSTFSQTSTANLTLQNGGTFKHLNDSLGLKLLGILNGNGIIESKTTQVKYLTPGLGFLDVGSLKFIGDLDLPADSFYNVEITGLDTLDFVTVTGTAKILSTMTV